MPITSTNPSFREAERYRRRAAEFGKPKTPHPCESVEEYPKLMVTPMPNKRRPEQAVAFIGKQLCFFEQDVQVTIGVPIEVMITRTLYHKNEAGGYKWDSIMALVLLPITSEHELVTHTGFECSGSMCRTTANVWKNGELTKWVTPGRTDIFVAENVNAYPPGTDPKSYSAMGRHAPVAKRPGRVWILKDRPDMTRIEGVARVEDMRNAQYVKL